MRARNAEEIRRLALARGAEAEIGGRAFNSSQQRVVAKPAKAAESPPAAPSLTHADVVRITSEMLADSERRIAQSMAEQANALTLAITKALRESAPPAGRVVLEQKVKVSYDQEDRITDMTLTPVYQDTPATRADS